MKRGIKKLGLTMNIYNLFIQRRVYEKRIWGIRKLTCLSLECGQSSREERLLHFQILSFLREERLPNHSGKVSIPLKPSIHRVSRTVKCWISSGRELSLAHPFNSRNLSFVWECWMKLRLGKTSSSSSILMTPLVDTWCCCNLQFVKL